MDDSMKKALGERVVFRKIPRLIRGMSLLLCLLVVQVTNVQADPQKQKISMDMSDVTIEEVLQSIEEKSDYYFLYNSRLINVERKVNVRAKNKPVAAILEDLFASGDVDYEVKGTQIVLSPMSMRASARSGAKEIQQQKTVSGRIVDEQGEPVIGANVVEKGTTNGTVTDADGRFSLSVSPNAVLHVSYIGYLEEDIPVSGFLLHPSTIFRPIDNEALFICDVNPYISSLGKFRVTVYTVNTKACAFSQTFNFLKSFIGLSFLYLRCIYVQFSVLLTADG